MMNEDLSEIVWLTIIAGRKQKDSLLIALTQAGGRLINTMYGRGSADAGYFKEMFGFVTEEHKVVITSLMRNEKAVALLELLVEKFSFDKPNTGIAFTSSVETVSF